MDMINSKPNSYTIGGVNKSIGSSFVLHTRIDLSTQSTFRASGQSSGYQVPVGKKLIVRALHIYTTGASSSFTMAPQYTDNDLGIAQSATPTNPIYVLGNVASFLIRAEGNNVNPVQFPMAFEVPAGKYPGLAGGSGTGGAVVVAICDLVNV